jgi:hypothetical protein
MASHEGRKLKIENIENRWRRKPVAYLRLKGKWLLNAGFAPGAKVAVIVQTAGVLTVRTVG